MVTTSTHPLAKVEYHVTSDVKPQWLNVVRAMQAACYRNQGYATIAIKVLVNREGEPLTWSEPKMEKIHPKVGAKDILLDLTNAG
jgi:hypothetical protein